MADGCPVVNAKTWAFEPVGDSGTHVRCECGALVPATRYALNAHLDIHDLELGDPDPEPGRHFAEYETCARCDGEGNVREFGVRRWRTITCADCDGTGRILVDR